MSYRNLTLHRDQHIALLMINRPEKMNALNRDTLEELAKAVDQFINDPQLFGLIITGRGEKAFVAGADIEEIAALDQKSGLTYSQRGQHIFNLIEQSTKPVIAAVNGYALGGGCELAMACHIRFAAEEAKFGQPEVNLGIIPGFGGTQRLSRLVGRGRAMEIILSGRMVDAQEALKIGLVNKVTSGSELIKDCKKLLEAISQKGPQAVSSSIRMINQGIDLELPAALALEAESFSRLCATQEKEEGTAAFLEKRKANFKRS